MIAPGNSPVDFVNPCILSHLSSQFMPSARDLSSVPMEAEHSSTGVREKGRSVLVIDDVSDVTEMLSVLLTHAGYEVCAASSAQEAIALALDHHFDMIISDIGMPDMNGYELAEILRSKPGYAAVPMIAVTGFSMFDDRNRSLTAGFNAHVTKPIDPRSFLDLIEQL
ncbi:MAG: response regulator [Pyrinomonadaceae bacterium]|nr:response regulator [Pyrinomonadaceae bacterium]